MAAVVPLPRTPVRPEALMLWRGATVLRRTPGRIVEGIVLAGAASALALTAGDRPTAALLAGLVLYVAGSRLLEPLREEVDAPGRAHVLLRSPWGEVLFQHTLLPMALLATTVLVTALVCGVAGLAVPEGAALASTALLGVPTAVLAAAMSARRGGRLPVSVLSMATGIDPSGSSGFLVVGWVLLWPVVGAVAAGGPIALAGHGSDFFFSALGGFVVAFGLMAALRATPRP